MPLKEADKSYDFKKIEEKVQKFWADNDIYDKTMIFMIKPIL